MPVPRPSRLVALAGAAATLTTLGLAPPAAAAVPAAPPQASVMTSAPAAPQAPAATSTPRPPRTATRLAITITPGSTLTVTGVLTRRTGQRVHGRWVAVYVRTADTGEWRRARLLRTRSDGKVQYRITRRADQQFTLRFGGDRTYRAAASATLVPRPSAWALDPNLVAALAKARAAARKAGVTLVVNSGYRTWSRQQRMYDDAVRRYGSARAARLWVLPPAESTHVRGLALDIGGPASAAWLSARGARWGLCRTYAGEPWHLEYRPDWVTAFGGRCPPTVATPGDPDPLSPRPRVPVG